LQGRITRRVTATVIVRFNRLNSLNSASQRRQPDRFFPDPASFLRNHFAAEAFRAVVEEIYSIGKAFCLIRFISSQ
jgi:hypothetical protein